MNFAKVGVGLEGRSTFFSQLPHLTFILTLPLSLSYSHSLNFSPHSVPLSQSLSSSLPFSLALCLSLRLSHSCCLSVSISLSLSLFLFLLLNENQARRWFRESFAKGFFSREGGHFGNKEFRTTPTYNTHICIYICMQIHLIHT